MNYSNHLEELRADYVQATPKQRLAVAIQRLQNPEHGPNLIITYVSAIEGFARSIALHQIATSKENLIEIYPKHKHTGPSDLIRLYLEAKLAVQPEEAFGERDWELFEYAVSYRNLLAHEATYLGQDKYPDLIAACERILSKLAEFEGLAFEATKK